MDQVERRGARRRRSGTGVCDGEEVGAKRRPITEAACKSARSLCDSRSTRAVNKDWRLDGSAKDPDRVEIVCPPGAGRGCVDEKGYDLLGEEGLPSAFSAMNCESSSGNSSAPSRTLVICEVSAPDSGPSANALTEAVPSRAADIPAGGYAGSSTEAVRRSNNRAQQFFGRAIDPVKILERHQHRDTRQRSSKRRRRSACVSPISTPSRPINVPSGGSGPGDSAAAPNFARTRSLVLRPFSSFRVISLRPLQRRCETIPELPQ